MSSDTPFDHYWPLAAGSSSIPDSELVKWNQVYPESDQKDLAHHMAENIPLQNGMSYLDMGCVNGEFAAALLRHAGLEQKRITFRGLAEKTAFRSLTIERIVRDGLASRSEAQAMIILLDNQDYSAVEAYRRRQMPAGFDYGICLNGWPTPADHNIVAHMTDIRNITRRWKKACIKDDGAFALAFQHYPTPVKFGIISSTVSNIEDEDDRQVLDVRRESTYNTEDKAAIEAHANSIFGCLTRSFPHGQTTVAIFPDTNPLSAGWLDTTAEYQNIFQSHARQNDIAIRVHRETRGRPRRIPPLLTPFDFNIATKKEMLATRASRARGLNDIHLEANISKTFVVNSYRAYVLAHTKL